MKPSSLNRPEFQEFDYFPNGPNPNVGTQDVLFAVKNGEKVQLRVFLDKSILEVFANGRQCIAQVLYPTFKDAVHIQVFTDDVPIKVESI